MPLAFLSMFTQRRYAKYFRTQEGLRKAREMVMLGFMTEQESREVAERHAVDYIRRRRLRKMIRHRQRNKGESLNFATTNLEETHIRCANLVQLQRTLSSRSAVGSLMPRINLTATRHVMPATQPSSSSYPEPNPASDPLLKHNNPSPNPRPKPSTLYI